MKKLLYPMLSSVLCVLCMSSSAGIVYAKSIHAQTPSNTSSSIVSEAIKNANNVAGTLPNNSSYVTNFASIVNMTRQQAQFPQDVGQSLIADTVSPTSSYDKDETPPMHIVNNSPHSLFNYYADLALIKEIIPDQVFRIQVLPLVEKALENEPKNQITFEDWQSIEKKIMSLKASHGIDYPALYLAYLEKKSMSESMHTMLDKMGEDMNNLGDDLSNEFQNFIDKNKDFFSPKEKETEVPETQSM